MAAANGTWELTNVEGMQAFYDEIKSPEEYRAKLRALVPELKATPSIYHETINFDGKNIHRVVKIKGETKRDVTIPVGVETDTKAQDGRSVKVKVTIDSDHKATFHERGEGFEFTSTIEISGSTLTNTSVAGSKTAVLTYKKV